jgi:two-component system, NarL family, nitrate/nitrite response regulator NarL
MGSCVIYGERTPARDRLASHLAGSYSDLTCVETLSELLESTDAALPDVLVVDADRGSTWLEVLRRVRQAQPSLPVVVIGRADDTGERDPRDEPAARAMRLGARGFLRAGDLAEPGAVLPGAGESAGTPKRTAELSGREMDVLRGMTEGRSNAEIAAELVLAEDTVKTHARRLFRKLGAGDRADAVARGFRQGLLR